MQSFKEFAKNISPRGHRIIKVLDTKGGEMMVTKDQKGKFNVMFDNQVVDTLSSEREAMKAAKNFGRVMGKR
jgi:hypothetical protein